MKINNITFRVTIFLLVSLAWSYIYFVQRPIDAYLTDWANALSLMTAWIPAFGLFFMASLLRMFTKSKNKMSIFGKSKINSSFSALLPILCLMLIGLPNEYGVQQNAFGLFVGIVILIYTLFEEYGWRGYLRNELDFLPKKMGIIAIGIIWYIWHWSFVGSSSRLWLHALICFSLIGASFALDEYAKQSQSILVCASIHSLGNICFFYGVVSGNLSITIRLIIAAICIMGINHLIGFNKAKKEDQQRVSTENTIIQFN